MLTDDRRNPVTILEEWRAAERRLAECPEASVEYDALAARVHQLAREYHDASGELAGSRSEPIADRPGLPAPWR